MNCSMAVRSCPPYSLGQPMPSHPSLPIWRMASLDLGPPISPVAISSSISGVTIFAKYSRSSCWSASCSGVRASSMSDLRLLFGEDAHRIELGATAVGVAHGRAHTVDLVLAGLLADLHGGLRVAQHARGPDGIRAEHAARRVDGHVAVDGGGAGVGHLPALALGREAQVLHPHGLVPAEGNVDLGHVDLAARVLDARLAVDVGGAVLAGSGVHLVAAGEHG